MKAPASCFAWSPYPYKKWIKIIIIYRHLSQFIRHIGWRWNGALRWDELRSIVRLFKCPSTRANGISSGGTYIGDDTRNVSEVRLSLINFRNRYKYILSNKHGLKRFAVSVSIRSACFCCWTRAFILSFFMSLDLTHSWHTVVQVRYVNKGTYCDGTYRKKNISSILCTRELTYCQSVVFSGFFLCRLKFVKPAGNVIKG